jgi:hypothetical protein
MRVATLLALTMALGLTVACIQPSVEKQSAEPSPSASPETFVVPAATSEPTVTPMPLAQASFTHPAIEAELRSVFDLFYKARSLSRGGQFDVGGLRRLLGPGPVGPAYADYTLRILDQEVRDARAGKLLEVSFSGIEVRLISWGAFGAVQLQGTAQASVTRTRTELRANSPPTQETATYLFAAERQPSGADGVAWVVYDFLNPATGRWISEPPPITTTQVAEELTSYFADFYAGRSVTPGQPFEPVVHAAGSYAEYTRPLLEVTKREVAAGTIKEIRYADISVKLVSWDERATQHGGLALVEVTRTAHVTRASGPEPPQTATYRFRVHRHEGPFWLAVDFFRPDVNRWVTELAGARVIVPEGGHG